MARQKTYGILLQQGTMPKGISPADFSRPGYKSLSVWNSKRKDRLAVILQSSQSPYRYQVVHGMSSLFFKSLEEAENYCETHGFIKQK